MHCGHAPFTRRVILAWRMNTDEINPNAGREDEKSKLFQKTRWTMVIRAQSEDTQMAFQALGELCRMYWYPLYAFARRSGCSPHDAEDVTQGFFAKLLEKDYLAHVGPEKGKLRSFFLAAFKNYMHNVRRGERALKRGGGQLHLSIDHEEAEERYGNLPADNLTADVVYERHWTLTVLDHVYQKMECEYRERGKERIFESLRGFLSLRNPNKPYAKVAAELGMTEGNIKVTANRMRHHYRELLREEIAQTVSSQEEIEEEIQYLFTVFA